MVTMDGGSTDDGTTHENSGPGADLLMGFLSDFRSTAAPPTPTPPKRRAGPPRDIEPPVIEALPPRAVADPPAEAGNLGATVPGAAAHTASTSWQAPSEWQPPAWQPPSQPTPPVYGTTPAQPVPPAEGRPPAQPTPPGYWQPPAPVHPPSGGDQWQPSVGKSRSRLIGASLAAITLVAGAVGYVRHQSAQPSYPASWDPRVEPVAAFVQSERGLHWKHPVKVEFLPAARFNALMAKESAPDPKSADQTQAVFDVMRAVGVASGNVDLGRSEQQFAQSDVVGQYVDSDRTVYVSGDQLTPYVRSVLAHELTHALQAQYFDLQKMSSGQADDESAVTALIEGDAMRVQDAYEQTLSQADQDALATEEQQGSSQADSQNAQDGIPQFLVDQAQFPYDFGPTFVESQYGKGGNPAVDEAFRNPPTLDSQIVDPEMFVAGSPAPKVAAPPLPKGARQVLPPSGFGEVSLLEMLGDQLGFAPAWSALQGWTADQVIAYRQAGRVCVDIAVLNDGPDSASSLLQAGQAWESHLQSATVARSGATVDFHACDPGPSWKPSTKVDDPYQALAVRSVLMYQLMADGHLDSTKAVCAADEVMSTLGPKRLEDAEQSSDPNSPAVKALGDAVSGAAATCA